MQNLALFFESLGVPATLFFDLLAYSPLVLFAIAIVAFVVTMRRQSVQDRKDKMVRKIVAAARQRKSGLSNEEIAKRLAPREVGKGRSAHIVLFEALLKIARFDRKETERKLVQSGDRDPRAISRYILQRGLGMVIAPVFLWILAPMIGLGGPFQVIMAAVGVLAGGIVVDSRLDRALSARRSRVAMETPVLLDLLTIYLEAGQPFDASLGRASIALEKSFPVIAQEAGFLIKDLDMSVDREKTLREFGDRLATNTAKTFVNIVVQSERRGNAVAPSLRMLAKESRKEVITDIERKAQKLPTVMQLPMFLFILPAIFASVLGPAVIQIMQTFSGGLVAGN